MILITSPSPHHFGRPRLLPHQIPETASPFIPPFQYFDYSRIAVLASPLASLPDSALSAPHILARLTYFDTLWLKFLRLRRTSPSPLITFHSIRFPEWISWVSYDVEGRPHHPLVHVPNTDEHLAVLHLVSQSSYTKTSARSVDPSTANTPDALKRSLGVYQGH